MIFIIKGFRTIVFIFIVISTTFLPICPPVFFRCLSNSGIFTELWTTSFIESTRAACSDSVGHNRIQVLSIPVLLRASSQDWTCNLQMIDSSEDWTQFFRAIGEHSNNLANVWAFGQISTVLANDLRDRASIHGRLILRLKEWYLIPLCSTLSIIKYGSKLKWSNPGEWSSAHNYTPRLHFH